MLVLNVEDVLFRNEGRHRHIMARAREGRNQTSLIDQGNSWTRHRLQKRIVVAEPVAKPLSSAVCSQGRDDDEIESTGGHPFGVHRFADAPLIRFQRRAALVPAMFQCRSVRVEAGDHRKHDLGAPTSQGGDQNPGVDLSTPSKWPVHVNDLTLGDVRHGEGTMCDEAASGTV